MTTRSESILTAARRLVIKVGSSLLVNQSSGAIHRQWMDSLAADIARCRARGQDIILVTSGAVAVGRRHLNLTPPLRLDEKQAAAATGQIRLAHAWQESLAAHSITVAQMLLTLEDSEDRQRYINARNTLDTLLRLKAVPVINENDTVATAELRFGDNDRLAARVAQMAGADVLVLFSDIDGLYTADPRKHPQAEFIPEVHELTPEIEAMAGNPGSAVGSGGTLAGVAMGLREKNRDVQVALADPFGAALYSWYTAGELKSEGTSITEGIGQSRITANLEGLKVDHAFQIPDAEALEIIFDLVKHEGLCMGGSTGINVAGAIRLAREIGPGKTIVTLLCDHGSRYQSKIFNPAFLRERDLPLPQWLLQGARA